MSRLTVVTGDRTGLVADVSQLLAAHRINIGTMNGRAVGKTAVLHVEVDNLSLALALLTGAGLHAASEDVIVFQVDDSPGALARISRQLAEGKVDIRMMQTLSRSDGACVVAIATNNNERAGSLLAERLLRGR